MTARERANLGFSDELDNFDADAWTKPKTDSRPRATERPPVVDAAHAAGFRSREPRLDTPKRERRRRTGRNAQFNIKARPETIEAFCEVADANGWGLGETLEQAVELLRNAYLPSKTRP